MAAVAESQLAGAGHTEGGWELEVESIVHMRLGRRLAAGAFLTADLSYRLHEDLLAAEEVDYSCRLDGRPGGRCNLARLHCMEETEGIVRKQIAGSHPWLLPLLQQQWYCVMISEMGVQVSLLRWVI